MGIEIIEENELILTDFLKKINNCNDEELTEIFKDLKDYVDEKRKDYFIYQANDRITCLIRDYEHSINKHDSNIKKLIKELVEGKINESDFVQKKNVEMEKAEQYKKILKHLRFLMNYIHDILNRNGLDYDLNATLAHLNGLNQERNRIDKEIKQHSKKLVELIGKV